MTESEWLASEDPRAMLDDVTKRINPAHDYKISDRKLRLFACACRRQTPHEWDHGPPNCPGWLDIEECPERSIVGVPAIDHATLFISGSLDSRFCPPPDVAAALLREIAGNPCRPQPMLTRTVPCDRCNGKGQRVSGVVCGTCDGRGSIAGNADWITPTVLAIAQGAYDERREDGTLDPERLAVLADALEEAGCPMEEECDRRCWNSAVWEAMSGKAEPVCLRCQGTGRVPHPLLAHLRGGGVHVRGCFALDLVLGKE